MAGPPDDDHHTRVRRRRQLALDLDLQFVPVGDDGEETIVRRGVLLLDDLARETLSTPLRRVSAELVKVCDGLTRAVFDAGRDPVGTARELDELAGPGRVTPEHVMSLGFHSLWAGDEQPARAAKQGPLPPSLEDGVRIGLVDTAIDQRHPWLTGVKRLGPAGLSRPVNTPEAAHGTFVAGVLRQRLPEARLVATSPPLLSSRRGNTGLVSEVDVARALHRLLTFECDTDPIDIVNLSVGAAATHTGMLAVDVLVRQAHADRRGRPFALVASAGNAGSRIPFLPAAQPYVVGVSALTSAEPPVAADFSNRGPWVSASAEGSGIESSFVSGLKIDSVTFGPFARWSGTSFAAPTVTAAIAARALDAGVSAPAGAQLVLTNPAHLVLVDHGVVVPTP
ncbi:MAG: S8 family serine peptidase [Actinomycetota bacterium]